MGIASRPVESHWNYYLAFDADLGALSRYVDFHEDNFNCFSLEIARILLASAAEVDVVCKLLCQTIKTGSRASKIHEYRDVIVRAFPRIPEFEVVSHRFGLTLCPWDEWKTTKKGKRVPFWWSDYNKVKHERSAYFDRANLRNALNAVAGLFVLVLHLYAERAKQGALVGPPHVLDVRGSLVSAGGVTYGYRFD